MKQNLYKGSLILLVTFFCTTACKKSVDPSNPDTGGIIPHDTTQATSQVPPPVPFPVNPVQECNFAPDYGDSIVYPQPVTNGDYFVYPQNNQGIQGTYLSWPAGLVLDSKTGAIDLTKSETGERFALAFVKYGTTDTCMSQLIVAGAAYMDSVYVLSLGDTTAKPYYNANPYWPAPCLTNQGEGCKFDYNNYAKNQGVVIDQKTGFIDLKKTMKNSLFGLLPINGTTLNTTVYYWLNDNSNYANQKIQLQIVFYNHRSDISGGLLGSITNSLVNTLDNLLLSKGPSPRPPLIIIVRDNN